MAHARLPRIVQSGTADVELVRRARNRDEAAIRAFCDGQIAHQKIPRYVRFVEDFPMTVTGKVQKFVIRQMMIEELGLVAAATA